VDLGHDAGVIAPQAQGVPEEPDEQAETLPAGAEVVPHRCEAHRREAVAVTDAEGKRVGDPGLDVSDVEPAADVLESSLHEALADPAATGVGMYRQAPELPDQVTVGADRQDHRARPQDPPVRWVLGHRDWGQSLSLRTRSKVDRQRRQWYWEVINSDP